MNQNVEPFVRPQTLISKASFDGLGSLPKMHFIPNAAIKPELLKTIGVRSVEDLFADVPAAVRTKGLNLPAGLSDMEAESYLRSLLRKNQSTARAPNFVGGTLKEHYVPPFVERLVFRQEFYTSYTAYQAEVAQGTLQAVFEYQSMAAELLDLEVVNASMYDASTALGEAGLMCYRETGRKTLLVPKHLAPEKRATLHNYVVGHGIKVVDYGYDPKTGASDVADATRKINEDTAGVLVENPNAFGVLEEHVPELAKAAHDKGALLVQGFDLSSLGLVTPPGQLGADIAIGDGTTLAFPLGGGGPQLGIFGTHERFARKMPGKLMGATRDADGNRAYCMTLQTREQHIRREKATSNICTNETLLAIALGAHLAALGPSGMRELAEANAYRAHRLHDLLKKETQWRPGFTGPFYNEFTVRGPVEGEKAYDRVGAGGVTPGYPAGRIDPVLKDSLVVCSTEVHSDDDHARLVAALKEVA
ncbi:MAG: aminomethyl-transferring glycine dehydrogenase subunit GcvPA [Euryarchaeota archaeon]|nr:aminomethyl-transferring glycine dehydrogenase subunit GcvPA [Euryarchaeota archaeon]